MALVLVILSFAPANASGECEECSRLFDNDAILSVFSPAEKAYIPEVKDPEKVSSKTDFSDFPNYKFSYHNELIVKAIDAAEKNLDIAIYSITLKEMPEALVRARDRGVKIRMIIDQFHVYPRPGTQIKKLIEAGINIRTLRGERSYGVMHNKITIVDKQMVITGSYNWTFGATFYNHENQIVTTHPIYTGGYNKYFSWMWSYANTLDEGAQEEVEMGYYGEPPVDPNPVMNLNGHSVPAYLFSPNADAENKLAAILARAEKSIDAVTFTFSSGILADAVIAAAGRGVKVRFMTDKEMGKESVMVKRLFDNGVEVRWRGGRVEKGAMHNKFVILDGEILQTGSFNWTVNANWNSFENMIFTDDSSAVNAYQEKFDWFYSEAQPPKPEEFTVDKSLSPSIP